MAGCLVSLVSAPEMQAAHPVIITSGGKSPPNFQNSHLRGWKEETAGTNERGINRVISETDKAWVGGSDSQGWQVT